MVLSPSRLVVLWYPYARRALAVFAFVILVPLPPARGAAPGPPSLLVLLSGAPDNLLEMDFLRGLQSELRLAQSRPPVPHSLHINFLELLRFAEQPEHRRQLAEWLSAKYRGIRFDAVVTNNLPALEFALEHRELWPGVPLIFAGIRSAQLPRDALPPEARGATVDWDIDGTVDLALALLPQSQHAAIVAGRTATETALAQAARDSFARRAPGVQLIELVGLNWDTLMSRVSSMPPDAFILAIGVNVDPQGRALDQAHALRLGVQAANVPVFILNAANFGVGSVGGSLVLYERIGQDAARRTLQALRSPGSLPALERLDATQPMVDARVLERWAIDEARVPKGTQVLNRSPTLWRDFRGQTLGAVGALMLLTTVVIVLLLEQRRRRRAEAEAKDRLAQLARMDRMASMGQLSASLAHELNQPLGAVRNYAEGAERLLGVMPPPLDKLRLALTSIRHDSQRAADIIARVRAMFGGRERPNTRLDIGQLAEQTLRMVGAEAARRGVALHAELPTRPVDVEGDDVQLQQVIVNLLLNALDAVPVHEARVHMAVMSEGGQVRLAVSDNGPGIAADQRARVFEPFFTTKADGMGMGLALARTIVESHGGEIALADADGGGTRIEVRLPALTSQVALAAQEARS
jgi:signal transduction histidine kinase